MAARDINVIALVKGGERYVFLYDDDSRDEALRSRLPHAEPRLVTRPEAADVGGVE